MAPSLPLLRPADAEGFMAYISKRYSTAIDIEKEKQRALDMATVNAIKSGWVVTVSGKKKRDYLCVPDDETLGKGESVLTWKEVHAIKEAAGELAAHFQINDENGDDDDSDSDGDSSDSDSSSEDEAAAKPNPKTKPNPKSQKPKASAPPAAKKAKK